MTRYELRLPATALVSYVAAATTWVTLLAWTPFAEKPSDYMVPLLGACLLVATTGAVLRSTRTPVLLVPLVELVVVSVWLHHRWAGDQALGGWLPTPESIAQVRTLIAASADAAQSYASPVPQSVPEFAVLMILAGTVTAVAVDLLACGLRRAPLAGLPLLAAYTAPVSIVADGVSWLTFAAAALLFLALIACQEAVRLTHWGQQVSSRGGVPDPAVTGQAVWSSARKIGVSATGLAVVVPLLVPTLSLSLFGGGDGNGGNGNPVTLSNPIADLKRDLVQGEDVDMVRVRTAGDPAYLRYSVLDTFDGETWRPSGREIPVDQRASGLIPRPPGLDAAVDRRTVPWSVDLSNDYKFTWLPAPYPVYSLNAPGDWRYDRRTLDFVSASDDQSSAGISYDLEAVEVEPTAEQLADAGPAPATVYGPGTDLPDNLPEMVRELALQVTSGTQSKYDAAKALQQWFRVDGGFRYSTDRAQGNGVSDLEAFLTDGDGGRVGYCEQFAASMALMGRSLGIPSRVAIGFLRPEPAGKDTYVFSAHDLHAWPEMYFEGTGWVRFEPTPGVRTGAAPGYTRQQGPTAQGREESSSAAAPRQNLNRFDQPSASTATGAAAGGQGGGRNGTWALVGAGALLLALALLLTPRLLRAASGRRRWAAATTPGDLAETAWAELRATAVDLGIAWNDRVTLRTRARDLVGSFGRPGAEQDAHTRAPARGADANPEAARALERLVRLLEEARYARSMSVSAAEHGRVRDDLDLCVEAMYAAASRRQRTRATWLPVSLLRRGAAPRGSRVPRGVSLLDDPGVDHAV